MKIWGMSGFPPPLDACGVFWYEGTRGQPKDAPTPLYSGGVTFALGRGREVP